MQEVTKKYVYQHDQIESYKGLFPLRDYASMSYFNYIGNEETYMSLGEISVFLTECLVEVLTRENIDLNNFNCSYQDFFITFFVCNHPERKEYNINKSLYFKYKNKFISISENNMLIARNEPLKMKNVEKDKLLTLMLSAHQLSLSLLDEIVKKCNTSKKLKVIEKDNKIELEEESRDDDSDFQQIG